MKNIVIPLIIIIFLGSCEIEQIKHANLSVTDYDSLKITSIDYITCDYFQPDIYCDWHPDPGSISHQFDFDNDSINDYSISIWHRYDWLSPATNGYAITIKISSLSEGYSIASKQYQNYHYTNSINNKNFGDELNDTCTWNNSAFIFAEYIEAVGIYIKNIGPVIVGLRRVINDHVNYGWLIADVSDFKADSSFTFFDEVEMYPSDTNVYILLPAVDRLYDIYPEITLVKSVINLTKDMDTEIVNIDSMMTK